MCTAEANGILLPLQGELEASQLQPPQGSSLCGGAIVAVIGGPQEPLGWRLLSQQGVLFWAAHCSAPSHPNMETNKLWSLVVLTGLNNHKNVNQQVHTHTHTPAFPKVSCGRFPPGEWTLQRRSQTCTSTLNQQTAAQTRRRFHRHAAGSTERGTDAGSAAKPLETCQR